MTGSSGKPQTATTTPSNTAKTFSGTSPASLDQLERMFENQDKDYDEHTDIESPKTDFGEDELEEELAELEANLEK